MDDIESLCQRVIVLNEGHIFLDGSLEQLRKKMAPERRLIVDLQVEHDTIQDSHAKIIKQEGHRVWLSYNPTQISTPELIRRITMTHAINDLYVENPPIEEIIAKLNRDANL
jgi:ABC-2 type transport system ATP-binding protein